MPFKSKAQRVYLAIHEPAVAKEFAKATPKGEKLPEHVSHPEHLRKINAMQSLLKREGNTE